jgi:uncharacterized protein YbaR (Trm112 family)
MRACPWCRDEFELVMKDGHLTCPTCRHFLVKKGEPGWEEGFGSRIGKDEYWMRGTPEDDVLLRVLR